jgi:hypothetical protein
MQQPTFGQAGHTLTIIAAQNPSQGHMKTLHDGYLTDLMQAIINETIPNREILRVALGLGPLVIYLAVDYGRTFKEMIQAGAYDWKNDNITPKNFPITGSGKDEWEFDLVHPNRDISTEDAHKETAKDSDPANPWIDAKIEHLLAFGEAFPETQRKFPIVALGSVAEVSGKQHVPYLYKDGSKRNLNLTWYDLDWGARYRFLRVRKKISDTVAPNPSAS